MALSASLNITNFPSLAASKVVQDLTYTAQTAGAAGNSITITYVDPGMAASLSVTVVGSAITVHLANSGSAVTSTASQIKTAVDGSSPAHALVSVAVSGTGSTVQMAQSSTPLTGGFDTAQSVSQNEEIPCQLKISNSGGGDIIVDSVYPRVTALSPRPSYAISSILPQPVTVPAGQSVYVPLSFIVFGTESGTYKLALDVCSSASGLLVETPIQASFTI